MNITSKMHYNIVTKLRNFLQNIHYNIDKKIKKIWVKLSVGPAAYYTGFDGRHNKMERISNEPHWAPFSQSPLGG